MTGQEIFELARKREPAPEHLTLSERTALLAAKYIYGEYSAGRMSKDEAAKEKQRVLASFEGTYSYELVWREHMKRMNEISAELLSAEKSGCEHCRRVARIFDGREKNKNGGTRMDGDTK